MFFLSGSLFEAIERDFGSFDIFRAEMTAKTVSVQGSGWGWLVSYSLITDSSQTLTMKLYNYYTRVLQGYEKGKDRLVVTTCSNQDPLQATTGM